jgi:hypothetical protein
MSRLRPHLPFDPQETHLSFANRLAALHTGGRVQPFLRYLTSMRCAMWRAARPRSASSATSPM